MQNDPNGIEVRLCADVEREIFVAISERRDEFAAVVGNPDQIDIAVIVNISGNQTAMRDNV